MTRKLFSLLTLVIFCLLILIACKKDTECENCETNNKLPVAIAGNDITIFLPQDSAVLDGSNSFDPDGTIIEYEWNGISNATSLIINNKKTLRPTIKNLINGVYKLQLRVIDNRGGVDRDTIVVIVADPTIPNTPPIANAGMNRTITLPTNTVLLDGTSSYDLENSISIYSWSKIAGPSQYNITNSNSVQTTVTGLVEGIYHFELTVTDFGGLISKDTVMMTVKPASANLAPVASAGFDKIITLPANSITLDGTWSYDPDNNPITYNWLKISGPSTFDIQNFNSMQAQATSLVEGVYQFKLTVTDNAGLSSADTVKITVRPPTPPTEMIFQGLAWNYWHDPNDPAGVFDETYLWVNDSLNVLSYTPITVYVKLNSSSSWVQANPIINGNCTAPYTYYIVIDALGRLNMIIDSCPTNPALTGTGASVKIVY